MHDRSPSEAIPPQPPGTSGPPRHYACSHCSYNLVGVAIGDPCPECGKLFLLGEASEKRVGAAVASMVLGIFSVVGCVFYGLPGIVCGILALVYAKKAREAVRLGQAPAFSLDFAKAGKACGWVGIGLAGVFLVLLLIYTIVIVGFVGAAARRTTFNPPPPPVQTGP